MRTDEPVYFNFTPVDLWRLGVQDSPRLDKVRVPPRPPGSRSDIATFAKQGRLWVKAGTGGVSLFDGPNPRLDGSHWWRVPANSAIPIELKITKNHQDKVTGLTHYRIEPVVDLPLHLFVYLLGVFAKQAERADFLANHERAKL